MKKSHAALIITTLLSASVLLTGCDNPEKERKVKCTKLYNEMSDVRLKSDNTGMRKQSEIIADMEALSCHRSDIIQG